MSSALGLFVASQRFVSGLSRKQLADAAGYTEVMIGKIERGERSISEGRMSKMAEALGVPVERLREEQEKDGGSRRLKVADAMALARTNASMAKELQQRAEKLTQESEDKTEKLRAAVERFEREVVEPIDAWFKQIHGLPDDLLDLELQVASPGSPRAVAYLEALSGGAFRKEFMGLLRNGSLGAGAGAAAGSAVAAASYLSVATWGVASTGTAIAGLSGVAATNATLAAFGGGALAAGGLGMAGGVAVLAGIVALPVIAVSGIAVAASGSKALSKQRQVEHDLAQATQSLDHDEAVLRKFGERMESIESILMAGGLSARKHLCKIIKEIDERAGSDGTVAFTELSQECQDSVRHMSTVVLTCAVVLALPIVPQARIDKSRLVTNADGGFRPTEKFSAGSLDPGTDEKNEALELALEEAALRLTL